ncbi:muconolactone Delta-isomerase family protein [Streptomyces sp. NPDC088747]
MAVVGQDANLSVFDVTDTGRLNDILWSLPLFPTWTSS